MEEVTKTVTPPVPYRTYIGHHFPNYLRGCESYYKEHKIGINSRYWVLKDKYRENRPTYDWNITYTVYDIELTVEGKEEVERRYYMHLRNMEKYLRLMD